MDRYEWIDPITKDKFAVTALESFFEDTETARGDVYHTHASARSEILRLASDLKAKDTENADLIARLGRTEKALDQAVAVAGLKVSDDVPCVRQPVICITFGGARYATEFPDLARWLKERR